MTEQRDIVARLLSTRWHGSPFSKDAFDAAAEIARLRGLLRYADGLVIWEHTRARSGFQEEIEAVLGIGEPLSVGDNRA